MAGRFEGRSALVTGAASGIGRAVAVRLAGEGARVACLDRDASGAEALAAELGGAARALACDVAHAAAVSDAVARAARELEGLDVVCNAAGVGRFEHFADLTPAGWREVLAVNLDGTFHVSHAALPHLLARRGVIVNVASLAGLRGQAYTTAYSVSKAGVVSLTKCMALEYAKQGLRVCCVCPGGVRTPFLRGFAPPEGADPELVARLHLLPRLLEPEEVAEAVAWLASGDVPSANGLVLPLDHAALAG